MPFAQRLTCTIDDACEVTGLGRTKLYEHVELMEVRLRKTEDDPFELFEWFVESHSQIAHEQMLNILAGSPDVEALRALSRDDLLYEYRERMVASTMAQSKKAS